MDKDLIILKNEDLKIEETSSGVNSLKKSNDAQEMKLEELKSRLESIKTKTGINVKTDISKNIESESEYSYKTQSNTETKNITYEDLFNESFEELKERGLDVDSIDYDSFLSESEYAAIIEELDKPLPREEKWKKSDIIVVFVAGLIGGVIDILLGNRDNKLTGKNSKFSKKLNEIHETKFKHDSNAPIDFQGKINGISFGGGNHRELSKGHDILRFADGIKAFKNGSFEAFGFTDGVKIAVSSTVNQNGVPYQQLKLCEAIIKYCHHMLADLCSSNSLPFPGYSFLRESKSRTLRKLSATMYKQGFNLKNIIIQSASTISIEIIIRIFFGIQSVKKYNDSIDIDEEYSNLEALKHFFNPVNKDKLFEMLLVAHTITTAFNIGKIVITKNLASINITEIMSVVRYGIKVLSAVSKRYSEHSKIIFHSSDIHEKWKQLGVDIGIDDNLIVSEMKENLVIE